MRRIGLCIMPLLAMGLAACQSGPRTSRLAVDDMRMIVDQTIEKLAASDFVRERDATSPPIVITAQRVENRTSDVITRSERWYLMQAVATEVVSSGLARERSIVIVIPRERLEDAKRRGTISELAGEQRDPTHVLEATFRSLTRSDGSVREDLYYCEYRVTDLQSGAIAWADAVEIKRAAFGRSFN